MRLTRFRALPVAAAALATLTTMTVVVAGAGDAAPSTPTSASTPPAAPSTPVTPSADDGTPGFGAKPGTASYIVVLRKDRATAPDAASRNAARAGVTPKQTYNRALQGYAADLTKEQLAAVKADPDVAYVEPDRKLQLTAQITPTGVSRIFGPSNTKLGIGVATDKRVDVDVAVIDGGVNDHPDLTVVNRQDCRAPGTTPHLGACVPGGFDDVGHGTHVAGTIGAINNTTGVVGVAPGARIWSLKMCDATGCSTTGLVAAIEYVTANAGAIEVANMSLGGPLTSQSINDAIAAGTNAGVTFVAGAGNENQDAGGFSPANAPDVITVSALADVDGKPGGTSATPSCWAGSIDDQLWPRSNWGATVEIAAPGACILSTSKDGDYEVRSGTSMAAPHVAGAVAALAASGPKPRTRADVTTLRTKLLAAGNKNWTAIPRGANDPQEPLLDVHDPAVFAPALATPPTPVTWQAGATAPGGSTRSARAQCMGDPNGVYLFGGDGSSGTATSSSWRYDLQANTWKRLAAFPGTSRTGLAGVCNGDGRIHVIGGAIGANHWIYDTKVDAWISAPALNRAVFNPALASWQGKVHVVGGQSSLLGAPSMSVDIYDAVTRTWTAARTTQPMAQIGSVQVGKYLYLAGWWMGTSPAKNNADVLRYDLENPSWSAGPSLPAARFGIALTATDQALYAIGGFTDNSTLAPTATVTRLDLKDFPFSSWTAADPLPRPLGWAGAVCTQVGPNAAVTSIGGTSINATNPAYPGEVWRSVRYGERCALADTGRWQPGAPTPVSNTFPQSPRSTARCAAHPSLTYVIGGGTTLNKWSSEVWTFDALHGFWTRRADFPDTVSGSAAACTADGKIHVVGGYADMAPINQHWVFDPLANAWSSAPALPASVRHASVGGWGTKLVVLAGVEVPVINKGTTRVQIYDTASRTWTAGAPMPVPLGDSHAVQAGSSLYLVGGTDAEGYQGNTLLRLDLATMTWTTGVALPWDWNGGSVVVTSKGLYLLSGFTGSGSTTEVRRLDRAAFTTGTWTSLPSLPTSQIGGMGWCVNSGTADARIGSSAGYSGPSWALDGPSRTWQTVVNGERCA